jgi:membrane associated rhomboid family serine protease
MAYPQTQKRNKSWLADNSNPLLLLIVINVLVFITLHFVNIAYELTNSPKGLFDEQVLPMFFLPAKLNMLIAKPWTVLSHMFSHYDVWRLIGNVFFLWTFGYLLQDLTGNRHVIPVYFYGSLAGVLVFLICANTIPRFSNISETLHLTGAGVAVMTIALAATVTAPDYRIFPMISGGIPIWVITAIYLVIVLANLSGSGHSLPEFAAHLAGGLTGFFYVRQLQRGNDWSNWMHRFYSWLMNLFNPNNKKTKQPVSKQFFYKTKDKEPFTRTPNISQKRIDDILDKINQKGYDSLTKEEKEILKKAGEDDLP